MEHAIAHAFGTETQNAYDRGETLDDRAEMLQAWADFVTGKQASERDPDEGGRVMVKPIKLNPKTLEKVEMVDGRVYVSDDNWVTVRKRGPQRDRLVTDKQEADMVRFIAVAQSSGGAAHEAHPERGNR